MSGAHPHGKGDRDRTADRARFKRNYVRTFGSVVPKRGRWRVTDGRLEEREQGGKEAPMRRET